MPLGAARLSFLAKTAVEAGRDAITITANGDAQIDTSQSKFGGASGLFDGIGDYLSTPAVSGTAFGTGDFTLEAWIRLTNTNNECAVSCRKVSSSSFSDSANVMRVGNGKLSWSNGQAFIETGVLISINTWYHIAVTRESGTLRMFVDGNLEVTSTQTVDLSGDRPIHIGALIPGGFQEANGNIDEVRISSIARYTASFTPQTSAHVNDSDTVFLCHMDGTDGSTTFTDDNS